MTTNHKFILERYHGPASRYDCPACGSLRDFSRYIDSQTGQYIDPSVGKCNRENSCGYHLTPRQYFDQNPIGGSMVYHQTLTKTVFKQKEPILIPEILMQKSLIGHKDNIFTRYLTSLFGEPGAMALVSRYRIGSSPHWIGATVFWFIDKNGGIRAGQVKLFNDKGHTVNNHTTWIHYLIKEQVPSPWVQSYKDQDVKVSCLFGEHLLYSDPVKPIAIVEAPATAIVASVYFPEFIWLATGSLSYLTRERCRVLKGRNVVLFPDLGGFDRWKQIANKMQDLFTIKVADFLEKITTSEERKNGLDLRDYLTRYPVEAFRKQQKEIPHSLEKPEFLTTLYRFLLTTISS